MRATTLRGGLEGQSGDRVVASPGARISQTQCHPAQLDEKKQKAFIEGYEKLLNSLGDDEAVLFADAVHPTDAARPVGCWAPSQREARDRADERASTPIVRTASGVASRNWGVHEHDRDLLI